MSYVKKTKKPENKDELNIQELLKNSGVESMLDLNKLIGKTKKHFIESTLDAEFDEHMDYQKNDQNSRDVSFMLFNNLWFKCWFAYQYGFSYCFY